MTDKTLKAALDENAMRFVEMVVREKRRKMNWILLVGKTKQVMAILNDDTIASKAAYKNCCEETFALCEKCALREGGIDEYRSMIMQRIERLADGAGKKR